MPTFSPALTPARDRQKPDRGPSPTPGESCLGRPLLAEVVPRCWSFRPCPNSIPPWPARPGWSSHLLSLCPGPRAQSRQCLEPGLSLASPSVCVCVYACDATSPPVPCQGPRIHTACTHMLGLGHGPQSSCLRWALCKHFRACWVGVYLRGLASSLGTKGPSWTGAGPWIQAHDHHTGVCSCMPCVLISHGPPPSQVIQDPPPLHTSHAVHLEAVHVSHAQGVGTHLPLTCCPSPSHPTGDT